MATPAAGIDLLEAYNFKFRSSSTGVASITTFGPTKGDLRY